MSIEHVLAVVPVSDLQVSSRWYEALFGRPADNNPMPTLAEWQVVHGAWVQIFTDSDTGGLRIAEFRRRRPADTRRRPSTPRTRAR